MGENQRRMRSVLLQELYVPEAAADQAEILAEPGTHNRQFTFISCWYMHDLFWARGVAESDYLARDSVEPH